MSCVGRKKKAHCVCIIQRESTQHTPPEGEVRIADGVGELPQALLEVVLCHVHRGGARVYSICVRDGARMEGQNKNKKCLPSFTVRKAQARDA
jgi:hypothetical protein